MIAIHEIGIDNVWTGLVRVIGEAEGAPVGWTRSVPPALDVGQIALWSGEWIVVDALPETPAANEVLPPLTRRQLRLGLLSIGVMSDNVEAAIAAMPDANHRASALIEWQDASTYDRHHHLIDMVAAALELPAERVDDLWRWSAGL